MSGFYTRSGEVRREAEKAERESAPVLSRISAMVNVPRTTERVVCEFEKRLEKAQVYKRLEEKHKKEVKSLQEEVKTASKEVERQPSTLVPKVLRACEQDEKFERELYQIFAKQKLPAIFESWEDRIEKLEAALVDDEEPPMSSEHSIAADENQRQRGEEHAREIEGFVEEQTKLKGRIEELEEKNKEEVRARQTAESKVDSLRQRGIREVEKVEAAWREENSAKGHAEVLLRNVRRKLQEAEKQEGELRDQIESEKSQCVRANSLVEDLRGKLNATEQDLGKQVADGTFQVEAKRQKIASLERSKDYNWSLAGSFWKDLREKEKTLEALEQRYDELTRSKASDSSFFERERAKAQNELEAMVQSRDVYCSRAANARKEVKRLQSLLAGMTVGLQETIRSRDGSFARADDKITKLQEEVRQLTQSRDGSFSRASEMEMKIAELQSQLNGAIRSRDGSFSRAEDLEKRIAELECQLDEMTRSRDGSFSRALEGEKKVAELVGQLEGMTRSRDESVSCALEGENKVAELEGKLKVMTQSRDESVSRALEGKSKNAELEGQLKVMTQSRDENCSRANEKDARIGELNNEVQQLVISRDGNCARANQAETRVGELEGKVQALTQSRDEYCSRANEKDKTIGELNNKVQQLVISRDSNCARANQAETKVGELEGRVQALTQSRDEHCSRAEEAEQKIGQLETEVGDITRQRDDNRSRADRAEGNVTDRDVQIDELVTSRDGHRSRADVAERQTKVIREEIAALSRGQVKQHTRADKAEERVKERDDEILALTISRDNERIRADDAEQKVRDLGTEIAGLITSRNDNGARAETAERSVATQKAAISELTGSRDAHDARASRLSRIMWRLSATALKSVTSLNEARSRAEVAERQVEGQNEEIAGLTRSRDGKKARVSALTSMVFRVSAKSKDLVRRLGENVSRADEAAEQVRRLDSVLAAIAPGAQELKVARFEGVACNIDEWLQRLPGMARGAICDGAVVAFTMVRGGPIGLTELFSAVRDLKGELAFLLAVVLSYAERRQGAGGVVMLSCLDLLQLHGQDIGEFLVGIGEQETELEAGLLQMLRGGRLEVQSKVSRCGQTIVLKVDEDVRFCWLDTVRLTRTGTKCTLLGMDGQATAISMKESNRLSEWFPELVLGYGTFLDIIGGWVVGGKVTRRRGLRQSRVWYPLLKGVDVSRW
ncbi:hypothetical protein LTR70_004313 [Exophiala xenobiotica]|nr:hypothetical protein LTR70_004313 [Exophiala xenobiotica]